MSDDTKARQPAPEKGSLSRRGILKAAAAMATGAALPGCGGGGNGMDGPAPDPSDGGRPNILLIVVDQMRNPQIFPSGITTADQFMQKFMPRTYAGVWKNGVKFANHISAATQCSPSRGVLFTGLYTQQHWLATTLIPPVGNNASASPPLLAGFPTLGSLLREAGYDTPYIGKWHCSTPHGATTNMYGELERYSFRGFIDPDPVGDNLEGTYGDDANKVYGDPYIAKVAVDYLSKRRPGEQPWACTVCFQNPHDQEFFPAGVNFVTYKDQFANKTINPKGYVIINDFSTEECATAVNFTTNVLAANNVPNFGYPDLPPNWESASDMAKNKPGLQMVFRQFSAGYFGGVNDQASTQFSIVPYPSAATYPGYTLAGNYGINLAPHDYWRRSLDCYTQTMRVVDENIGKVIEALPADVARNTVIVFTGDHGDYAGSHGLAAGKGMTAYREAFNVPLAVYDPRGRFTGDTDKVRCQLTSSVDITPMLVSMAYGGTRVWMQKEYDEMYSRRFDMFPLLKSNNEVGRAYALFATDEVLNLKYDFVTAPDPTTHLQTPFHIVGVVTDRAKLAIYSNFQPGTLTPMTQGQLFEYYDYATERGRLELDNSYANNPEAKRLQNVLVNIWIPNEMRARLPGRFEPIQSQAELAFTDFLDAVSDNGAYNPSEDFPFLGFVF